AEGLGRAVATGARVELGGCASASAGPRPAEAGTTGGSIGATGTSGTSETTGSSTESPSPSKPSTREPSTPKPSTSPGAHARAHRGLEHFIEVAGDDVELALGVLVDAEVAGADPVAVAVDQHVLQRQEPQHAV